MAESCKQCGDPLVEPGVDFHIRLRKLGGISYGSGREYCIDCWAQWFEGRHHHEQTVTLEVANEHNGTLAVSCRAVSRATILTKHGLSMNAFYSWRLMGPIESSWGPIDRTLDTNKLTTELSCCPGSAHERNMTRKVYH